MRVRCSVPTLARVVVLTTGGWLISAGHAAAAVDYYVSTSGNDNNSCAAAQNAATPKRTLNNAVRCLTPGSTLWVRGGTYPEQLSATIPSGTSWSAPVIIAAYPGEAAIMRPVGANRVLHFQNRQQYIEINGLVLDGAGITDDVVKVTYGSDPRDAAHHIRLRNCEIKNGPANGVLDIAGDGTNPNTGHNEYINCHVHHNGGSASSTLRHGFYIGTVSNVLVEGCSIHDNAGYGIQVQYDDTNNVTIRRNRIDRNYYGGLVALSSSSNLLVYNNVISNHPNFGLQTGVSRGARYLNNTVYRNGTGFFQYDGRVQTVLRNNILFQNTVNVADGSSSSTIASHNLIGVDPVFVDPGSGNFRLQSGSPAIDAGAAVSEVADDFTGLSRPQGGAIDIGAYEYASQPPAPPPPAPPAPPPPAPPAPPSPGTTYELVARHSGKCLDVADESLADGNPIIQWECHGGPNQRWRLQPASDGYYLVIAVQSGKALDANGSSTADGARVAQFTIHGGPNQQWWIQALGNGYYTLAARHSGKGLDVHGSWIDDSAPVIQWSLHGGPNQQWLLRAR
jgi:hypothetical protein